jgi:MftR C-terminal domain
MANPGGPAETSSGSPGADYDPFTPGRGPSIPRRVTPPTESSLGERRRALGQLLVDVADKDVDLAPLQAEFWLYAIRRPELQNQLSDQFRDTRDALARALAERSRRRPVAEAPEALPTVLLALFQGLVQLRRMDPQLVSEDLYGQAIEWLLTGIAALAEDDS